MADNCRVKNDVWSCRHNLCCMTVEDGQCDFCIVIPGHLTRAEGLVYFENQLKGH